MRKRMLKLEEINLSGDTQPRAEINRQAVDDYAGAYANGTNLPPLTVFHDGKDYWLADGFHRRWGAEKAGKESVPCEILDGKLADARWFSYAANQTHGMRRTNADKRKAVESALQHPRGAKMSDKKIAEHVGVDPCTVATYRAELKGTIEILQSPVREGRDGRTTNTANIGKGRKPKKPKSESVEETTVEPEESEEPQATADSVPAAPPAAKAAPEKEDDGAERTKALRDAVNAWWDKWPQMAAVTVAAMLENLAYSIRSGE